MNYETTETIQRLWEKFVREHFGDLPPNERDRMAHALEERFSSLLNGASGENGKNGFLDLIGFGANGVPPFGEVPYPLISPDFDASVIPSQLHAAAELYYIYQHEQMKVFKVLDVLRRLFVEGRMRIQRGPGARGLYLLEKWKPLRYSIRARMVAYRRAFNYGTAPAPAGAAVNVNFHRQFAAFIVSIAQYFRDLRVSEVIRGGPLIDQRPFGSIATIQRLGLDLRWALDRSTYGNILALTFETGHYLKTVLELLDEPDIKKAFDANTKWDVIEMVSNRHLGGIGFVSGRAKMAESGRRLLRYVADNDFQTALDPIAFQNEIKPIGPHAEAWLAAFRMTDRGANFPGVTAALKRALKTRELQSA